MELDAYRREAQAFTTALGREHYLHFAGLKPSLEVEPIYQAHAGLFTPAAAETLRKARAPALLEFCVEGLIGRATAAEAAELARREAELELDVEGASIPFRRAPIDQANEPDRRRRGAIEAARLEAIAGTLDPLHERILERGQALAGELGWSSVREMCAELSGIDLRALAAQAEALLVATEPAFRRVAEPRLHAEAGDGAVRRSDLPAFFRAPSLDDRFPAEPLVPSLRETLEALGVEAPERVTLDAESRATKSPRAFCTAARVPEEVYLVISPHGGRDDYEAILHEAGHAQHFAHVDDRLPFERRHLGDNSVTEAYAFLLQRLATEPLWLQRHLRAERLEELLDHGRATKLVLVRRYAAKLLYEVELHDSSGGRQMLRRSYARRLSSALKIDWPEETWLADVDPFFYAARYLRAWALESELAGDFAGELGPEWFREPEAGRRLRDLWAEGQPWSARELLGREPDLSALSAELATTA
ncbi:MAG TPA: hypothetical protein VGR10_06285 [Thermoleophilaceae bacterium]|nr:hypothetical protein [Thermoleophilaceae bacterium]